MERLTKRHEADSAYYYPKCFENCGGIGASSKCENCELTYNVCEKLGNYEDLEEQGRLIKLPIEDKNGDYRECVHTRTQCHHMEYKCSECPITELLCDEFYKVIDRCYEEAYASGCLAGMDLAKSEAEAKLSEMKKNESEERK